MDILENMLSRNEEFASEGFEADLKMMPSNNTLIIGCVDPRVDPVAIFKLKQGEAAVYRNVGGRVNPALLETMGLLRVVTQAAGGNPGSGLNVVVLHHTDCGINHAHHHAPERLARHLGVEPEGLGAKEVTDPYKSVAVDIAALKADPNLPDTHIVSGLVYDVATGKVEIVVPPSRLRETRI